MQQLFAPQQLHCLPLTLKDFDQLPAPDSPINLFHDQRLLNSKVQTSNEQLSNQLLNTMKHLIDLRKLNSQKNLQIKAQAKQIEALSLQQARLIQQNEYYRKQDSKNQRQFENYQKCGIPTNQVGSSFYRGKHERQRKLIELDDQGKTMELISADCQHSESQLYQVEDEPALDPINCQFPKHTNLQKHKPTLQAGPCLRNRVPSVTKIYHRLLI